MIEIVDLSEITNYMDDYGNVITSPKKHEKCRVLIRGRNNKITVAENAIINLDCNNAEVFIGGHDLSKIPFKATIRMGENSTLRVGNNVTCTSMAFISAVEGASVNIGDDCMFASGVVIRTDDAHPIFDIASGIRVNPSKNVSIGNHVWLGDRVSVLSGGEIGDGSVIGLGSIVKKIIPNNCIAVGSPAKITKRNIAWERPHLSLHKQFMKPDATCIKKSIYWNPTKE